MTLVFEVCINTCYIINCRAIAIKRKLEAQKEEKRRQEILAKRRDAQREATERFQRGNRPTRNRVSSAGTSQVDIPGNRSDNPSQIHLMHLTL